MDSGTENGVVLEAGDPIDEIFFGDFIPPTGTRTCTPTTFNGGVLNASCTHSYNFEGCAVQIPMDVTGQLNGNVFTFSGGIGYVASPPECVPEIELNLTGTATRVGFRGGSLSFLHR